MLSLYLEADIDVLSSASGTTKHVPVSYWAGEVTSEHEVLDRFNATRLPDEAWAQVKLPAGGSMLGINLTAARLYNENGQFVLGGYFVPMTNSIHWVAPVTVQAYREALIELANFLRAESEMATYSGHLTRHSAQMLELGLVDDPEAKPVGFTLSGDAPNRIAFNHGVCLPQVA